jgi:hypothetical protein
VIGYFILGFICDLVLGIWNLYLAGFAFFIGFPAFEIWI